MCLPFNEQASNNLKIKFAADIEIGQGGPKLLEFLQFFSKHTILR